MKQRCAWFVLRGFLRVVLVVIMVGVLPAFGATDADLFAGFSREIDSVFDVPVTEGKAPADAVFFDVVGHSPLDNQALQEDVALFFSEPIDFDSVPTPLQIQPSGEYHVGVGGYVLYIKPNGEQLATEPLIVRLSPVLRSKSGAWLRPQRTTFVFCREKFVPLDVFLIRETAKETVLGVNYPYPVSFESLGKQLKITDQTDNEASWAIMPGTDPRMVRITLGPRDGRTLYLHFGAGITDTGGNVVQREEKVLQYPPSRMLQVEAMDLTGEDDEGWTLSLQFSEAVAADVLREYLTVADAKSGAAIPFDLYAEEPSMELSCFLSSPLPREVKVTLRQGLYGTDKSVLAAPVEKIFKQGATTFAVQNYWWQNWRGSREGASLEIRVSAPVKLSDLKQHLVFDPPLENLRLNSYSNRYVEIYGDWVSKQRYAMTITAGLPYGFGETLREDIRINVMSPEVRPYVGFGYEGRFYFPRQAGVPLKLESRNVRRARLTLYRLFPSNLAAALPEMSTGDPSWDFNESWTQLLAETEVALTPGRDRLVETPISVEELFLKNTRGVFSLEVCDPEHPDFKNQKIVVWTDIGVLAYWQKDGLALFVHDLYSLTPTADAKVNVYSSKKQLMGSGSTNADGMLLLSGFSHVLGDPYLVVVERDDDYTFLELARREDDPVAYTASMPNYDRKGYDAFIYADRELYRPGEAVHLHWLVRTNYGDAVGAIPLLARVVKPNGRTLFEKPIELSDAGTGGMDLKTEKDYPTGRYTVALRVPGAKSDIGRYTFSLEDFVPNRMKVQVTVGTEKLLAGTPVPVHVDVQHLFGAPAADRKTELTVVLLPDPPVPADWAEYRFKNDSEFRVEKISAGEARTDGNGHSEFTLNCTPSAQLTYPVRAVIVGRAFELGGRAVAGSAERVLYPSDTCLGLALAARQQGGVDVAVAAVTPEGTPASLGTVRVTLEKQMWNYYVRRFYTHHETNWAESFEVVETREVPLTAGKGTTAFEIHDYGYYRVRVHSDATPQYSTQSFFAYGGVCSLTDAARPSLIKLTLDKTTYQVGDTVRARLESPFDGKGVVVLQGETIQKMATVDIRNGVGFVEFGLTRDQVPNVWIEATVVHALQADRAQVYPFSSFAMANVPVRDPERQLGVAFVDLPEEVLPGTEASFTVETRGADGSPCEAELTLAAVDEGIHAITGYKSPDPFAWLLRDRKPAFNRAHYYDKVAYDFEKPAAGGDLEALLGRRAASPDDNWIKPLALWSGAVRTDAAGKATVRFTLPEFSGQLRLVVVAGSPAAVGSAEGYVYVRRPYMLRTSVPRFVLPEDTFRCRAVVFNTRDAAVKARVSWAASGALVPSEGATELAVPAHGEATTVAPLAAGLVAGPGSIRWELVVMDDSGKELERLSQDTALPVRPPAAYQRDHEILVLQPGETRMFTNTRFIDDDRFEMHVTVSANPLLQLGKTLRDVVDYPYGCVEQVVSRLFPLYLLRQQVHLFDLKGTEAADFAVEADRLALYLNSGVARLLAMQTPSGGLAVWPGSTAPYEYGSVYGLHFLTMLKRDRQIPVPEEGYKVLQQFVRGIALDWEKTKPGDLYLRAYALYVLAMGGDLEALQQISRFDTVPIPQSARYLLAAALAANTQNLDRVKMYLKTAPSFPYGERELSENLNSEIRAQAVELLALQQMQADPQEIAQRAEALVSVLRGARSLSTQEAAFAIAALAQYLGDLGAKVDNAEAIVTGPEGEQTICGGEVYRRVHQGSGGSYRVSNMGKTPVFVVLDRAGIPLKPSAEKVASGMAVERVYFTASGKKIDASNGLRLRQGETYVVGLRVSSHKPAGATQLENLAVVDLLPAGLEVENPRLDADAIAGDVFKSDVTPSYLEVRDDRMVVMFDSVPGGTNTYYYVVRAVTPGKYQQPPLVAECMYDPTRKGTTVASVVEIGE